MYLYKIQTIYVLRYIHECSVRFPARIYVCAAWTQFPRCCFWLPCLFLLRITMSYSVTRHRFVFIWKATNRQHTACSVIIFRRGSRHRRSASLKILRAPPQHLRVVQLTGCKTNTSHSVMCMCAVSVVSNRLFVRPASLLLTPAVPHLSSCHSPNIRNQIF